MADTQGKIFITITDKRMGDSGGSGGEGGSGKKKKTDDPKSNSSIGKAVGAMAGMFVLHQMINVADTYISNIGNLTGDMDRQNSINNAKSVFNFSKNIVSGVVSGATFGGVYGGVVGGAIALVGSGIGVATNEYLNSVAYRKQQYQINEMRQLSGVDVLTNGGRI